MTNTVQPRYRNRPFVYAQLARRALFGDPARALTIGAKQRASGGGDLEVTVEEVAKIKELVAKFYPTLVSGSVWMLLESQNGKKKEG